MTDTKYPIVERLREEYTDWLDDDCIIEAANIIETLAEALCKADSFITNGVEFGFIRMPDESTPDPAHETPQVVRAALAKLKGEA